MALVAEEAGLRSLLPGGREPRIEDAEVTSPPPLTACPTPPLVHDRMLDLMRQKHPIAEDCLRSLATPLVKITAAILFALVRSYKGVRELDPDWRVTRTHYVHVPTLRVIAVGEEMDSIVVV